MLTFYIIHLVNKSRCIIPELQQCQHKLEHLFHFYTLHFPFSIFHFPFSIFHFPFLHSSFSIFNFPFSISTLFIFHFPFSIFHFPFSIFNFQFSIFNFQFSIFHFQFFLILFCCLHFLLSQNSNSVNNSWSRSEHDIIINKDQPGDINCRSSTPS